MQNTANHRKNLPFEDIEFQEIGENGQEFGEFRQNSLPAKVVEWKIPSLSEAIEEESRKFRVYPLAIRIGQAIGQATAYVLVIALSVFGQLVWFIVLVLVFVLSSAFDVLRQGHGARQGHRQRQDTGWHDIPAGWDSKRQSPVRTSQGQGPVNNINIQVNIKND